MSEVHHRGGFAALGRLIALYPVPFFLVMPLICIALFGWGFSQYEIEDQVSAIWIPHSGRYYKDTQYKADVQDSLATTSGMLAISYLRTGGNIITAEHMLTIRDRLNYTEQATISYGNETYTLDDICVNSLSPYNYPCYRMTLLDCYYEGGFDFDAQAKATWQASVASSLGISSSLLAGYTPYNFKVLTDPLGTRRQPLNYESDPTVCSDRNLALAYTAGTNCPTVSGLGNCDTVACPDCTYAHYCDTTCDFCGTGRYTGNVNDSDVLYAASDTCYFFDEDLAYGTVNKYLTVGGGYPSNFSKHNPLESARAIQHVWAFLAPEDIQERVKSSSRPGGSIHDLSHDDATRILYKFKKTLEKTFSTDWDDKSQEIEFTAFTDDRGAGGTFARMLEKLTESSVFLSLVCFVIIILIAIFFFVNFCDHVHSRFGLATMGTLLVIIAFLGAMGVTALVGIKVNIVHMWTLPFLIVGLGVDDMYIISLAAMDVPIGTSFDDYVERFIVAYTSITSPVSMTSLVNAGMFAMLLLSTIPAVFKTAWTALFAIILLYLTMITSLAALVALDMRRQRNGQLDVLCCVASAAPTDDNESSKAYIDTHQPDTPLERETGMWAELKRQYIRFLQSMPAHIGIAVFTLGLLVFSGVGYRDMPIGLDLDDFFPADSLGGRFTARRMKYFPVWPIQMNWKGIDYTDPDTQLGMVKNWEDVQDTALVVGEVDSKYVWTASISYWAMNSSFGLGNCDSSDVVYGSACASNVDEVCVGEFAENTLGLKLASEGGICYTESQLGWGNSSTEYCPTVNYPDDDTFSYCFALWANNTLADSVVDANINMYASNRPKMPIKYSQAAAAQLYAAGLYDTEDYVKLIKTTRNNCKHQCYMSGIPYDYYEQYLGIRIWVLLLSCYALAAGFVIASVFLFGEIILDEKYDQQTFGRKMLVSYVGAVLITLIALLSVFTVIGICSWLKVKLCGFSAMSYLMTVGFAVEYTVHITHRFLTAPATQNDAADRIAFALDLLSRPMFMAFTSSAVGILCLLFSEFVFVRVYFFIPLVVVLVVTYYYGVVFLPVLLQYIFCQCLDLHEGEHEEKVEVGSASIDKGIGESAL